MKITYTKHAKEKFLALKKEGWVVTKTKIRQTIKNPLWKGSTRYNQETALSLMDEKHILRIILKRDHGIIKVITFHLGIRGRYESTLR